MKRIVLTVLGLAGVTAAALAQAPDESIERALAAAPPQARAETTVVKWKPDFTYDTVKEGTNRWVCYDQSGEPGEQPFSAQCTSIANLDRVAQNRRFEAVADKAARQAQLDEAEAKGTRAKPEYGSLWRSVSGPDQAHARTHTTVAVPGATAQSTGLPDNPKMGGAWLMNAGTSTAHIMVPGS
ncbi:MAG TPA: hypothetical protein PLH72_04295 [Vicinamibacterales bacterium]|nr:hypothetical protein [Vicinamibacterales bacterium]